MSSMFFRVQRGFPLLLLVLIVLLLFVILQMQMLYSYNKVDKKNSIFEQQLFDGSQNANADGSKSYSMEEQRFETCSRINTCINRLGKNGTWVRDWEFARSFGQYQEPRVAPLGFEGNGTYSKFQPSEDAPYPWETSWKWKDSSSSSSSSSMCDDMDYRMSVESMCELLDDLRVNRIFMMGDSMTLAQFKSLVNRLGPSRSVVSTSSSKQYIKIGIVNFTQRDPSLKAKANLFRATLKCPPPSSATITKSDNSPQTTRSVDLMFLRQSGRKGIKDNEMAFEDEVTNFLNANTNATTTSTDDVTSMQDTSTKGVRKMNRLIAVFNLGAHIHGLNAFQKTFSMTWKWFNRFRLEQDENPGNNDIWFYRTTPSGHGWCEPRDPSTFNYTKGLRIYPFSSYEEFIPVNKNSWHLFDAYNKYAIMKIQTSSFNKSTMLLDVVFMTLLRPDGHTGGFDCLHYTQPGPLDWWNHMLYTQLKYIRRLERYRCHQAFT